VLKDYPILPETKDETILKTSAFYDTANGIITDTDLPKTIIVELTDGTRVYRVPERTAETTRGEDIADDFLTLCTIKNVLYLSVFNLGGALETLDFLQKWTAANADNIQWHFEDDVAGYGKNKTICTGTAEQLLRAYDDATQKPKTEKPQVARRTPLAKKVRPSPSVSANDPSHHGKILIGNDGKPYRSTPNCNGVHRWTKA
jgi:hypothetical protein